MCAKHHSLKSCQHHQEHPAMQQQQPPQHAHRWWGCELSAQDVLCSAIILTTFALFLNMQIPEYCSSLPWLQIPSGATNSAIELADNADARKAAMTMNLFSKQQLNWMDGLVCPRHSTAGTAAAAVGVSRDRATNDGIRSSKSSSNRNRNSTSSGGRYSALLLQAVLVMTPELCQWATAVMRVVTDRLLQVVAAPLVYGWLLGDLVHICVPQLRAAVLLFITAPLPYLNPAAVLAVWARRPLRGSSPGGGGPGASNVAWPPWFAWTQPSWYCQVPGLRTWLVVLQRLLRPAGAAASVGLIPPGRLRFSILAFWARHTQYLYLGWIACMMRVSFKLQLILGLFEWLLTLYASTAMHVVYRDVIESNAAFSFWHHFWSSLLLVYIMPCCIVHSSQKQQQQHSQQQVPQELNKSGPSSVSRDNSITVSSEASRISGEKQRHAHDWGSEQMRTFSGATSVQSAGSSGLGQCPESSADGDQLALQTLLSRPPGVRVAAASAVAAAGVSCHTDHSVDTASPQSFSSLLRQAGTSSSEDGPASGYAEVLLGSPRALQQLRPMLQQLLGEEEAAQTLAAVMAAKTSAIRPSSYQAVSTCLNVSVKVHFGQESLELVSPVLHSTVQQWLLQQVADDTAQSIAAAATPLARVTAVCFSGCVHLLANLYTIKPAAAAAAVVQADIEAGQVALEVAAAADSPAAGGAVQRAAGLLCAVQQGSDAAAVVHPTLAAARSLLKAVGLGLTAAGISVAVGSGPSGGLIEAGRPTADKAVALETTDAAAKPCHVTVSLGQSELTGSGVCLAASTASTCCEATVRRHSSSRCGSASSLNDCLVASLVGASDAAVSDLPSTQATAQLVSTQGPGGDATQLLQVLPQPGHPQPHGDQVGLKGKPAEGATEVAHQVAAPTCSSRSGLSFVCCSPCCLMAAQGGQVLQLAVQSTSAVNTSSAAGGSLRCNVNNVRVLVFQHQSLLLDQQVPVADIIRVGPLPALPAGALHVAVLPLVSTSPVGPPASLLGSAVSRVAEAPSSTAGRALPCENPSAAIAASAVPLLLQPVLVLPEPAALELEGYWQRAAAGLVQTDPVKGAAEDATGKVAAMEKLVQLHDVWEAVMSGVVCDATFLVSGSLHHVRDVPTTSEPPVGSSSTTARASSSFSCSRVVPSTSKAADCFARLGHCHSDSVDYDRSSDVGFGWSPAGAEAAASSSYTASQAVEATDCSPLRSRVEQMLLTRLMVHLATQKLWKVMEAILNLVANATAETNCAG